MKLILASNGFTTEEIVAKCEELVGKSRNSINVAVINEAYAATPENNLDWVLDDLNRIRDNFGGNLELVNLLAFDIEKTKERLELCDVIFVVGGRTDYLMQVFNKTGFTKIIPELLKTKVYVGSSAGSVVIGKRFSEKSLELLDSKKNEYGTTNYLELVDMTILPHLDSAHYPGRREKIVEAAKYQSGICYGLNDNSAIIVDGEKIYTIGSEPVILNN